MKILPLIQKLKSKRLLGSILSALGVLLLLIAKKGMNKVNKAKNTADYLGDFFTNDSGIWNPVIQFFGGTIQKDISKYDVILSILFILGFFLLIAGIITFFWHKKRSLPK